MEKPAGKGLRPTVRRTTGRDDVSEAGRNDPCPCGSGRKFKKCCLTSQAPSVDEQLGQAPSVNELLRRAAQSLQTGRLQVADRLLEQILAANPDHPDALHLSGHLADRLGNSALAFERIHRAIARAPGNAAYHNSLGIAYGQRQRADEAIASFRQALALRPRHPQALNNLALQLASAGEHDQAESSYRQLLELAPQSADCHVNLAQLLQAQGRLAEAESLYERALAIDQMNVAASSGRLANALYRPATSPADLLADSRSFARRLEQPLAALRRPHANPPNPDKRLRIGYVSADFRRHSVAYFMEPILARHDPSRVEVFCYSTSAVRDAVTDRLETLVDHWVAARGLDDAALAARIRADGIDILVDLSGHSAGNRLLVFARKPAPIQITWIGWPATTGLASMDYRFSDDIADPVASGDEADSERLIRLPRTCLCYRPPESAPPVESLPALTRGFVTFGSLNNPAKYNPCVVEHWAEILKAVPESRLMLKGRGLDRGHLRAATLAAFDRAGVAIDRVLLLPHEAGETGHFHRYNEIDIALDPFPYNGVTTTCEALWMGVPVIVLRGDRHSSRIGASILTNASLEQCVADTFEDYRDLALSLARDLRRLGGLRRGLRDRLRASALMDEIGVTHDVETAYREVWREWCKARR